MKHQSLDGISFQDLSYCERVSRYFRKNNGFLFLVFVFSPGFLCVLVEILRPQNKGKYLIGCLGCRMDTIANRLFYFTGVLTLLVVLVMLAFAHPETKRHTIFQRIRNRTYLMAFLVAAMTPLSLLSDKFLHLTGLPIEAYVFIASTIMFIVDAVFPGKRALIREWRQGFRRGTKVRPLDNKSVTIDALESEKSLKLTTLQNLIEEGTERGGEGNSTELAAELRKFESMLVAEFSVENLAFLKQVQAFRKLPADQNFESARLIMKSFIERGAECEINLEEFTRQSIVEDVKKASAKNHQSVPSDVFDTADAEITILLESDSFQRFKIKRRSSRLHRYQ